MKKLLPIIIVLMLPSVPLYAQLHFQEPVLNLGEVRGGTVRSLTTNLRNTGKEPLEILAVDRSCGCLAPRLERFSLQPGQEGKLFLEVGSLGQPEGPHAWFVVVRYRQGNNEQEARLQLKAEIRNDVVIQPTLLAFFGKSSLRQEITIQDRRARPLSITAVQSTLDGLRTELRPESTGFYKILVETTGNLPPQRLEGSILITTRDPEYPQFVIPVVVQGTSAVSLLPERVHFFPGQVTQLARLRSEKAMVIEKVDSPYPGLTCTWAVGDGGATLRVRVDRQQVRAGNFAEGFRIHLREPEQRIIPVPVEVE